MGWGFRKSIRVGRLARLNLSKKSIGMSFGFGPFRIGVNSRGTVRRRLTIPRTGLYYEERSNSKSKAELKKTKKFTSVRNVLVCLVVIAVIMLMSLHL